MRKMTLMPHYQTRINGQEARVTACLEVLLLQRTRGQFPALASGSSQMSITPPPGALKPSSGFQGTNTHLPQHSPIYTHINQKSTVLKI